MLARSARNDIAVSIHIHTPEHRHTYSSECFFNTVARTCSGTNSGSGTGISSSGFFSSSKGRSCGIQANTPMIRNRNVNILRINIKIIVNGRVISVENLHSDELTDISIYIWIFSPPELSLYSKSLSYEKTVYIVCPLLYLRFMRFHTRVHQ